MTCLSIRRSLCFLGLFGAFATASACTTEEAAPAADNITSVAQSGIRRQSIGNCWIYAVLGWVESVNIRATGVDPNLSESYLTYWHWFDQIQEGIPVGNQLETGGHFGDADRLISTYGMMKEGDFIFQERRAEESARQKTALAAIQAALATGALKTQDARYDRKLLRAELDKAFQLTSTATNRLDAVFGKSVDRTLKTTTADLKAQKIIAPSALPAASAKPDGSVQIVTLADLLPNNGRLPYTPVSFPYLSTPDSPAERAFWRRVKKALHAQAPVVAVWDVDFNALTTTAHFSKAYLDTRGPGKQGGHMTVASDYQAVLANGTRYAAGTPVTDPAIVASLMQDDTKVEFLRVKNSWGAYRPDRWLDASLPGYHDLDIDYIRGPLKKCQAKPDGSTDTANCPTTGPGMRTVYVPNGF